MNLSYAFSLAREADGPAVFALYRSVIGTPGCTWSDEYPAYGLVERDIRTSSLYLLRDSQNNRSKRLPCGNLREARSELRPGGFAERANGSAARGNPPDGGRLIAAAAAGPDDELKDFAWGMENPCELARVAVAASMQNRGIGSYLLQRVIAAVKARGFGGIRMLVSIENLAALALYDKNGFERLDTVHLYGLTFYRYRMRFIRNG